MENYEKVRFIVRLVRGGIVLESKETLPTELIVVNLKYQLVYGICHDNLTLIICRETFRNLKAYVRICEFDAYSRKFPSC